MAQAKTKTKTARIVSVADVAAGTHHLTLEMTEPAGLDFLGGQYVIVDSGIILPSGKAAKRAYSILSRDSEQARFELAVLRLPGGPGSGFLHDQPVGLEIRFSGPWGRLFLPPEVGSVAQTDPSRSTLLLATDTGITAMLGLTRSARFAPLLATCTLVWLRESPHYFLPERFVADRLPSALGQLRIAALPSIDHPERIPVCRQVLRELQARAPVAQAFLAGDGAVNYALLDDLVAAGVPATRDSVESFFNMPSRTPARALALATTT